MRPDARKSGIHGGEPGAAAIATGRTLAAPRLAPSTMEALFASTRSGHRETLLT